MKDSTMWLLVAIVVWPIVFFVAAKAYIGFLNAMVDLKEGVSPLAYFIVRCFVAPLSLIIVALVLIASMIGTVISIQSLQSEKVESEAKREEKKALSKNNWKKIAELAEENFKDSAALTPSGKKKMVTPQQWEVYKMLKSEYALPTDCDIANKIEGGK